MGAYVYFLANGRNGTLYVGSTTDMARRMEEHRSGAVKGFVTTYKLYLPVHVEAHASVFEARERERRIKRWHHAWKIALIEEQNPEWRDLTPLL